MFLLGIDVGTSSENVSLVSAELSKTVQTTSYPETESEIISLQKGWADQSPVQWCFFLQQAILNCDTSNNYKKR